RQGIEHGLEIESRAAYDFEHVGGGGLLLQGFAQSPLSLLNRSDEEVRGSGHLGDLVTSRDRDGCGVAVNPFPHNFTQLLNSPNDRTIYVEEYAAGSGYAQYGYDDEKTRVVGNETRKEVALSTDISLDVGEDAFGRCHEPRGQLLVLQQGSPYGG